MWGSTVLKWWSVNAEGDIETKTVYMIKGTAIAKALKWEDTAYFEE